MSRTKDEKFIIGVYEAVQQAGDFEVLLNPFEIGERVGINQKGVRAICRLLMRANFIKFFDEKTIQLTPHGRVLAESLLK